MLFKGKDKKTKDLDLLNFESEFVIDIRAKQEQENLSKSNTKTSENKNGFFFNLNTFLKQLFHLKFITRDKKYEFDFLSTDEIKKIGFGELIRRYFIVNKYVLKKISWVNVNELSIFSASIFIFSVCFNIGWIFLFFWRFVAILLGVILYKILNLFRILNLFLRVLKKLKFYFDILFIKDSFIASLKKSSPIEHSKKVETLSRKKNINFNISIQPIFNILNKILNWFISLINGIIAYFLRIVLFFKAKFVLLLSYFISLYKYIVFGISAVFKAFKSVFIGINTGFTFLNNRTREKHINMKSKRVENKIASHKEHEELKSIYLKEKFVPKAILSFIILMMILILPFQGLSFYNSLNLQELKANVVEASERAMNNFHNASDSIIKMDTNSAVENFSKADASLLEAKKQIGEINNLILQLSKFIPNKEARMASVGKEVLDLGIIATKLGSDMTLFFETILKVNGNIFNVNSDVDMIEIINKLEQQIVIIEDDLTQLRESESLIDSDVLIDKYAEKFNTLSKKIEDFEIIISEISDMISTFKIFLGVEENKKYLLVFQNTNEARATGGFIGSIAMLDFGKGKLKSIEVPEGGSYDLDGNLSEFIVSPSPLQLVSPRWFFRDANWWPDWSKSAKKLMWFYEHSGGETVDGCISFTPNILQSLLKITGPIDMFEEYGVIIDDDNFWDIIRNDIENNKKTNTPKTIIKDLFNEIISEFSKDLSRDKVKQVLQTIQENLSSKDVLFYFNDQKLQNKIEEKYWGGRIKNTDSDYLLVVNTNIAGGKSDKHIEQKIEHNVEIMSDGSIVDNLTIHRLHTASSSDNDYYKTRNVNWLRVYVPRGSKLITSSGFNVPNEVYFESPEQDWVNDDDLANEENAIIDKNVKIYTENGKTVFAGWSMIDAGEQAIINLKYKLPFKFYTNDNIEQNNNNIIDSVKNVINRDKKDFFSYSLLVQKQAGSQNVKIEKSLNVSNFYNIHWNYPENLSSNNKIFLSGDLKRDQFWAILFSN